MSADERTRVAEAMRQASGHPDSSWDEMPSPEINQPYWLSQADIALTAFRALGWAAPRVSGDQ